jgi:hypothetical protein
MCDSLRSPASYAEYNRTKDKRVTMGRLFSDGFRTGIERPSSFPARICIHYEMAEDAQLTSAYVSLFYIQIESGMQVHRFALFAEGYNKYIKPEILQE